MCRGGKHTEPGLEQMAAPAVYAIRTADGIPFGCGIVGWKLPETVPFGLYTGQTRHTYQRIGVDGQLRANVPTHGGET